MKKARNVLAFISAAFAVACGSASTSTTSFYPGGDHSTTVISGGSANAYGTPSGGTCLVTPNNPCLMPQQMCGDDGQADVLLNPDGSVLSILCYPAPGSGVATTLVSGQTSVSTENNELFILGAGQTVNGNVSINGNNSTVFGAGPASSAITGTLTVNNPNAIVRGVYIHGDTVINGNSAALFYCIIDGNLTINNGNSIVADCDIYGTVTVNSGNNKLVSDRIQGGINTAGGGAVCTGDVAFTDVNMDHMIEPDELGATFSSTCH
jgi:hypothetical protein